MAAKQCNALCAMCNLEPAMQQGAAAAVARATVGAAAAAVAAAAAAAAAAVAGTCVLRSTCDSVYLRFLPRMAVIHFLSRWSNGEAETIPCTGSFTVRPPVLAVASVCKRECTLLNAPCSLLHHSKLT